MRMLGHVGQRFLGGPVQRRGAVARQRHVVAVRFETRCMPVRSANEPTSHCSAGDQTGIEHRGSQLVLNAMAGSHQLADQVQHQRHPRRVDAALLQLPGQAPRSRIAAPSASSRCRRGSRLRCAVALPPWPTPGAARVPAGALRYRPERPRRRGLPALRRRLQAAHQRRSTRNSRDFRMKSSAPRAAQQPPDPPTSRPTRPAPAGRVGCLGQLQRRERIEARHVVVGQHRVNRPALERLPHAASSSTRLACSGGPSRASVAVSRSKSSSESSTISSLIGQLRHRDWQAHWCEFWRIRVI